MSNSGIGNVEVVQDSAQRIHDDLEMQEWVVIRLDDEARMRFDRVRSTVGNMMDRRLEQSQHLYRA